MAQYGIDLNKSVSFVTETINLPIKQLSQDIHFQLQRLEEWLEEIGREFQYFMIDAQTGKKAVLQILETKTLFILKNIYQSQRVYWMNTRGCIKIKCIYFLPRRNKYLARNVFLKIIPRTGERTGA